MPDTVVYADDSDAYVERVVTNAAGDDLTFTPTVAIDDGAYSVTATWQGDVGATRTLRIPVSGLTAGTHRLYLRVTGAPDFELTPHFTVLNRV